MLSSRFWRILSCGEPRQPTLDVRLEYPQMGLMLFMKFKVFRMRLSVSMLLFQHVDSFGQLA